ncbi:MAG: acetyl/propionyl/methylcrotonyl-CoA carboxylase subunit alpha [Pseudomonadota bacterium]
MFSKILVANRGEIACRVLRTAHEMGLATVAVYSDADAGAMHVEMADEAVRLGPASVTDSYLNIAAILEAARATGAQAIHPGYGFLSENPEFVEVAEAAGLTFVGPSAHAIRAMGLKDRAKSMMQDAGVPVVPGYHGAQQDATFLAAEADQIGYPVLIKAVAGGGGKGMRLVERDADFADALTGARAEAKAAFGNEDVLIEKYIASPRHIEVQVFGDGDKAVHLFERDCSLQRRHQKVIEEAPAPGMTPDVRAAMGAAAVRAAEAIGYAGAGTVEFIVDGSGPLRPDGFWFMEMNTRLQVEHPVTEAVTGIDLVEWQLRVAAGAPLPLEQDQIHLSGHAVEARLYAEDPESGFLPAVGTLSHLLFPDGLRADSGVRPGDVITPHYDPMIAKLICHAPDRDAAIRGLRQGLAETAIAGTVTNLGFLWRLLGVPAFHNGRMDTGLIDRCGSGLTADPRPELIDIAVSALALAELPRDGFDGWSNWVPLTQMIVIAHKGETLAVQVSQAPAGVYHVSQPGGALKLRNIRVHGDDWHVTYDTRQIHLKLCRDGDTVTLHRGGVRHRFQRPDPLLRDTENTRRGDVVLAPMPGQVRRLSVTSGQHVEEGEVLLVLEAMKMEHSLPAPRAGQVAEVRVSQGAQVSQGDTLILLGIEDG